MPTAIQLASLPLELTDLFRPSSIVQSQGGALEIAYKGFVHSFFSLKLR